MLDITPCADSTAWVAAFDGVKKDNKSSILIESFLSFDENQGVYIYKKVRQKLGHFFVARFVEYVQPLDSSIVDLKVGKLVDISSDTAVGELKLQTNTDNSSSKKQNIRKLKEAAQGKIKIYGYLFDEVSKQDDDIYFLGGTHLFSHFGISNLYTRFIEEINDIQRRLADAYREQFSQRYAAHSCS